MSEWLWGAAPLSAGELGSLFLHFALLSLLAVGGAITTVPDMHRFVVGEKGWLTDAAFSGSVALAQAAPGPNVLFVAVIGYNVSGMVGVAAALTGCMLPSSTLALTASRWGAQRRDHRGVRAFTVGLAPITIGLLIATSWVLTEPTRTPWGNWLLFAGTVLLMVGTRHSPLWMIAAGAVAGALGWV